MVIRKVPRLRSMSRSSSASKFSASSSTDDAEAGEGIMNDGELRRQRKIDEISLCLNGYDQVDGCGGRSFEVDLWRLRELCLTKGGLVNGKISLACPRVYGILSCIFYEFYWAKASDVA